ncbi:MAG: ABC transporter substrate-binding protein, partial [Pseudolabrys sp.]
LVHRTCPLLGVKRTSTETVGMSAYDPKRTSDGPSHTAPRLNSYHALSSPSGEAMRRREFLGFVGGAAAMWPLAARAQQPDRIRRLGVLIAVAESDADVRKGITIFQQRLQELGWRDGNNIRIDYRWGNADAERIQALAKELVDLQPDVLVGHSTPSAKGLLKQTRSSPIVFLTVTDPLGQGLVSSLSHPNGNITGFSVFEFSLGTKWLETLKQIAPGIRRVTAIFNPETAPYYKLYLDSINAGVPALAVESIAVPVHSEADIENAIRKVGSEPDGGLFVLPDSHNVVHRKRIIELAAQYRLPTIYYFRYFASDGGLIAYGPDEMDLFQRTAGYVNRILKGTSPSDLPVQQPTKFELVINLKTAKAIGIQIPVSLLARADEVIE